MSKGKVYIASMKMRGKWAPRPKNCVVINVTSMQGKGSVFRRDFSPMSPVNGDGGEDRDKGEDRDEGEDGYKGYYCFENYWQSGKVYEGLDDSRAKQWWKNLKEGKRRYPLGKGRKILHSNFDGKIRGYIESRKEVYVPEYYDLIQGREGLLKCLEMVQKGQDVVVYDFDGPRDTDGEPVCLEVDLKLLRSKIEDPTFPFGHGYVVAGCLLGLKPSDYC